MKLYQYIFNDIIKYLIHCNDYSSLKSILELSLISKSTFKFFQNYLKDGLSLSLLEIIRYINYNRNSISFGIDDNHNDIGKSGGGVRNSNKLIQYNEIEILKIKSLQDDQDEVNKILEISNQPNIHNMQMFNRNEIIRVFLVQHLLKLRKVVITDALLIKEYPPFFGKFDYTCNGFFKVKLCHFYWDQYDYPLSADERIYGYNGYDDYDLSSFDYSFNFIKLLNPSKIIIETSPYNKENPFNDIHISFEALLKFVYKCQNSIKSIDFINHFTPLELVESFLKLNGQTQNKELKLPKFNELSIILREFNNDKLCQIALNNNNSIINKLIFKSQIPSFELKDLTQFYNPTEFINSLFINSNNNSIRTLGLNFFNITDSKYLVPLLDQPNITALYCDSVSLHSILQHCNENQNIIKIIYQFQNFKPLQIYTSSKKQYQQQKQYQLHPQQQEEHYINSQLKIFNNFFNNNKSKQLKIIKIKYNNNTPNYINNNYNIVNNNKQYNMFINKLKESYYNSININNSFILKIK